MAKVIIGEDAFRIKVLLKRSLDERQQLDSSKQGKERTDTNVFTFFVPKGRCSVQSRWRKRTYLDYGASALFPENVLRSVNTSRALFSIKIFETISGFTILLCSVAIWKSPETKFCLTGCHNLYDSSSA